MVHKRRLAGACCRRSDMARQRRYRAEQVCWPARDPRMCSCKSPKKPYTVRAVAARQTSRIRSRQASCARTLGKIRSRRPTIASIPFRRPWLRPSGTSCLVSLKSRSIHSWPHCPRKSARGKKSHTKFWRRNVTTFRISKWYSKITTNQ